MSEGYIGSIASKDYVSLAVALNHYGHRVKEERGEYRFAGSKRLVSAGYVRYSATKELNPGFYVQPSWGYR